MRELSRRLSHFKRAASAGKGIELIDRTIAATARVLNLSLITPNQAIRDAQS
jgi:predicted nucleic acid-binding protein